MEPQNETTVAVGSTPAAAPDSDAFKHAIDAQKKRTLGAAFANKCLSVSVNVSWALIVSLVGNLYCVWALTHPDVKYFATENGRITRATPTDKPNYSLKDVAAFGADTIRDGFTLDFVHFRDQMTDAAWRFDEAGYADYYKALTTSNVMSAVREQRMNLSVDVGPGVIRSKGTINGRGAWEFQYPVTLKLDGQQTSVPAQRFIFTQRIQRVDEREKNAGLETTQIITSSAN